MDNHSLLGPANWLFSSANAIWVVPGAVGRLRALTGAAQLWHAAVTFGGGTFPSPSSSCFCRSCSHCSVPSARRVAAAQMEMPAHKAPFFSVSELTSVIHRWTGKRVPVPAPLFSDPLPRRDTPRLLCRAPEKNHGQTGVPLPVPAQTATTRGCRSPALCLFGQPRTGSWQRLHQAGWTRFLTGCAMTNCHCWVTFIR